MCNRQEVKEIIKSDNNVIAIFNGHQHWNKPQNFTDSRLFPHKFYKGCLRKPDWYLDNNGHHHNQNVIPESKPEIPVPGKLHPVRRPDKGFIRRNPVPFIGADDKGIHDRIKNKDCKK